MAIPLSNNSKLLRKQINWMIPTALIKPLMPPCLPMPPPIRPSSRCISTGISAMPINSALSPMGLALSGILLFTTRTFFKTHPDILVEKKSDSPDEDKSLADSKALISVLKDFFLKHPLIKPKIFLSDAAFDSVEIYKYLLMEAPFEKAYIPLNSQLPIFYFLNLYIIPLFVYQKY